METEETPPEVDSSVVLESAVLMETTGSELSEEIQTLSAPDVSKVTALYFFWIYSIF